MKRVRTPGLAFALFMASAGGAFAEDASKPFMDLPGAGKPVRAGVIITTEGGVDGPQSTYYAEGSNRKGSGEKLDPNSRKGLPPIATAENATTVNAGGRLQNSDKAVDMNISDDPSVGRFTSKEGNLSERRYERDANGKFSKDDRFTGPDSPEFGKWNGRGERRDIDKSESFGSDEKFDSSDRPEFGRWAHEDERRERDRFVRTDDRADVRNWSELFSRDKSDKYTDRSTTSTLAVKMNDTVKRMQTYEQVSMQNINRTAFRRGHSDTGGDLPVAPVGGGPEGMKSMSAPRVDAPEKPVKSDK